MIVIKHIKTLHGTTAANRLQGTEMGVLGELHDAWLILQDDQIYSFGAMADYPAYAESKADQVIDASGRLVLPAFCDSHTHLVYAASREDEFVDRVRGLSYTEIAKRGGGILNSADQLHELSENELFEMASKRCRRIMTTGTGAVEIKSGYGLNTADEIKMLRVIARLKESLPLTVKSTFLGAHAVSRAYVGQQTEYVEMLCREMLPAVAAEGLADYVDVFCDTGFFTVDQTDRILQSAALYGLRPKIHANEMAVSGGVQVGVRHGALSVDHLEHMDDAAIACLRGTVTMPTGLPGASFFLGLPYAPLRKMVDAGLGVAIASDYNPGSSPCGNMQFMLALAVIKARLMPNEALAAATINSAYAMGLGDTHGSIAVGKRANILITNPITSLNDLPYSYGENHANVVILNGKYNYDSNND